MKVKVRLHQARLIIIGFVIAALCGGLGFYLGTHKVEVELQRIPSVKIERKIPQNREEVDFSLFWDVWDRLEIDYLDQSALDPAAMVYGAIQGMVSSLDDPYTVFLRPQEQKEVKDDLEGAFEGVGIQLGYQDGQLTVIAPLLGTPAYKAGVKAGDFILKIDGQSTDNISLPEAVRLIRGEKGTTVILTLLHRGETDPFEASITRATIIVPSVDLVFVGDNQQIAHLKLLKFGDRTAEEWNRAVDEILDHEPKAEAVVLDLRNNPGGYLSGAVFIASEFLTSGVVVQQEYDGGVNKETFSVNRVGKLVLQPMVVLINKGSASASEIVAGALQDYDRATVVGEKSFGKGTIQEAQELPGNTGLHITTARWLLPLGASVDKEGITPNEEVFDDLGTEDVDEQLEKAIEILEAD